jgi:16S rRNA (uracil1498-N3)-methyltransferase
VPLAQGEHLLLPAGAARHVQVLRLQPGDTVTLFNGEGGEWTAAVERMGRSDVSVVIGEHAPVEREAARAVHLAIGMPANDRMDWLVEKATELGAASIRPLMTQHGVLRLAGERAQKKQAHWQSVAAAACEQCGRNRVPVVHAVGTLADWLASLDGADASAARVLLAPQAQAQPLHASAQAQEVHVLSGPEGGLSGDEEAAALAGGFMRASLGPRVLRAETAPLAALAVLTLGA